MNQYKEKCSHSNLVGCEGEEGHALYIRLARDNHLSAADVLKALKNRHDTAPICWTAHAIDNGYAKLQGTIFVATDKLVEDMGELEKLFDEK